MKQFLKFITLTFIYGSTCFLRPHAHHQELNNYSSSPWFYRWSVVLAMLLVLALLPPLCYPALSYVVFRFHLFLCLLSLADISKGHSP
jgi:hypothetical protein